MNKLPVKRATVSKSSRRQNIMKAAYGPGNSESSSLKNRHPANQGEQIELKARRKPINWDILQPKSIVSPLRGLRAKRRDSEKNEE